MKIFNRFTLWVILASGTLTVMAGSILSPVLNLIREGLGVDPASVGLIITAHGLFIAIFSPLWGNLIDRIGTKKPFMFGLALYGLAGGSGLFITTYWGLIISRAFLGIAVAAIINSITVTILNLYKGEDRNKIMGWRGSANAFGGIIWPLIGGLLGGLSWHLPFAVYLLGIPLSLVALITMPETGQAQIRDTGKDSSVLHIFRSNPILFVIYGLLFLTMVLLYAIIVFVPQLLENIGISTPFYISLFISTMAVAGGTTSLMYGKIKARLSYKTIILIALALWAVGFSAISQAFSGLLIAVSVALVGIGQGMLLPAVMVWVGETVPISFRGRIVSYMGTFGFIGQFLSPVIFGPVLLLSGLNGVFLAAGAACTILFLSFLVFMRK
jgi:MFS family permease